jgi:photosystem II stability/assembly factor-like uncharacterized protein
MLRHLRTVSLFALFLIVAFSGSSLVGQSSSSVPVADEFDALHFRSIGPASMSGRITDFAVYEANPAIFYVGSAHGGLWKTTNNGATFEAEFQDVGLISVGDVTISQSNPDLVWVGAGEGNNRQSISWGGGIWKSTDGGKSFKNMGLVESKHINRIVIDPNDDNVVLVAAQGPLFGSGGDRGVYKTTDGGATWKQVLKVDADTGANDLVMAASDPKVLYASTYQRRRTQCCMNGGGPGSGVWKSTDGGDTWTRLSGDGLPAGSLGRIGLDVYRASANIVYASIEAEGPVRGGGGGAGGAGGGGRANAPGSGDSGLYRSDDGGATWKKGFANIPRPMYFSQVRVDPNSPDNVYMGGVGLHMSIDGGRSFVTDAAQAIHDDVHAIWIDPKNSDHLMIGDDGGVAQSYDMSKTWIWLPNLPVGLFYHVGYDLETPYNVCGGMQDNYDWCGPSASRFSRGIRNDEWFTVQGGDGFVVIIDQRDSRIVYSESQDGNMTRKNKVTGESKSIRPNSQNVTNLESDAAPFRFNWDTPLMFSPHDPGTLLAAANRVFKSTDRGDSWTVLSPDLTTNANRDDVVTMGVKGSDIRISRNDGISAWPTIVALAESPRQAGVYYAGTDDGVVSVSRDAGKSWQNVTDKLPGFPTGGWVSKVAPSRFDAGTVYVTVDGHRENDFKTYMWVSNDFGQTFRSLNGNLSGESVKTLTEDTRNPDVLYVGAETGLFVSLDRGRSWRRVKANFPTVRVDEITIHPRDNAMILATHGRALWILDHLEPIQEYAAAQAAASDAKLFSIGPALEWKAKDDRNDEFWGHQFFVGENPPTDAVIQVYLKKAVGDLKLKITDVAGKDVRTLDLPEDRNKPGIQTVCWDLRVEPIPTPAGGAGGGQGRAGRGGQGGGRGAGGAATVPGVPSPMPEAGYMPDNPCGGGGGGGRGGGFGGGGGGNAGPHVMPGTYNVALVVDGKTIETKPMKVVMDPEVQFTEAQRKRYNDIVMDLHELHRRGTEVAGGLNSLYSQMGDVATKVKDAGDVPAAVKTQFEALQKDFDAVREKFGVPLAAGGGGRGGRGGGFGPGGAQDTNNVLARVASVKGQIMNIWEMPSDALVKQYTDVRTALPKAVSDANAFLLKAMTMSQTLKKYNITLNVPAPVK